MRAVDAAILLAVGAGLVAGGQRSLARVYPMASQDRWDIRVGGKQGGVWIWQWSASERAPERCGQQVSLVPAKFGNIHWRIKCLSTCIEMIQTHSTSLP
jgi:hypothetical protein